jgi:hypothetical protein
VRPKTLKDARKRVGQYQRFTVKDPKCFGRLLGDYLFGATRTSEQLFVVREGDKSRLYTRDDLESIATHVCSIVEMVEGCRK